VYPAGPEPMIRHFTLSTSALISFVYVSKSNSPGQTENCC
jgi:hypothetical protein